ncbi:MAG: PKD domain-containing protein, partial [Fibrobacter sp.]|nr:PKD domain-containing protein [Fibrobacter sp.]
KFEIISPLDVDFSVDARQTGRNSSLPVSVEYYIDSELAEQLDSINSYQKEMVACGTHEFRFKSSSTDGHEVEETYIFQCIELKRPKIDSFFCTHDTLPVIKSVPVKFIANISNSTNQLDSIVYIISETDFISKKFTGSDDLFSDTLSMNMVSEIKGKKKIKLILYDNLGKADSASLSLVFDKNYEYNVGSVPVIDSILVNKKEIHAGDRIDFEIKAHDSDGEIEKYFWTFGDKGLMYSDSSRATYTYYTQGKYVVTVAVTDDSGNTSRDSITIDVFPPPQPQKYLRILSLEATPNSGNCPLMVNFKATVNDTNGVTYKWSFSDWGFSEFDAGTTMFHRYDFPGSYTVMLIVKNAQEQDTMTTIVTALGPILEITVNKTTAHVNETVRFSARSSGNETYSHYNWFFPDTAIFNTDSPEIDYVLKKPGDCYVWVTGFTEPYDPFKNARGDILITVPAVSPKNGKD